LIKRQKLFFISRKYSRMRRREVLVGAPGSEKKKTIKNAGKRKVESEKKKRKGM